MSIARDIIAHLQAPEPGFAAPASTSPSTSASTSNSTDVSGGAAVGAGGWDEPHHAAEELRAAVPADPRRGFDMRAVLARVLDGSRFDEFKLNYGPTLVTGAREGSARVHARAACMCVWGGGGEGCLSACVCVPACLRSRECGLWGWG